MSIITPPTHAVNSFSQNGPVLFDNYPLHKFNYAVVFNVNPGSGIEIDVERTVVIVKNVSIGGWDIETDIANEYNRKRITYTKINFQDTNIVMHDVADGKGLRLAQKYYEYYFADGRDNVGFGYDTLFIQDNNRRYIFDSIDIYQFQARKANLTKLVYPKMTNFTQDTADYAAVDGLMELSFTFKPEYIQYERNISLPGEVLNQMLRGGTPEQLSNSVESFIDQTTTVPKDSDQLRQEALDGLSSDTESAVALRATQQTNRTIFTQESIESLSTGSPTTRASNSSLDSFGRVSSNITRKLPPSNQRKTNQSFDIQAKKVSKPDGDNPFIESNNSSDFQGGDE